MNKFIVLPCLDMEKEKTVDYNGPVVALACTTDPSLVVFFPVSPDNAALIDHVLKNEKEESCSVSTEVLGVYQTMLDSWNASGRFLSGIIIDTIYSQETQENVIAVRIILSSQRTGQIDGLVRVNFVHAVLLAAMEKVEITIDEEVLDRLMPERDEDPEGDEDEEGNANGGTNNTPAPKKDLNYPVDKNILDIARKIMGGKIK